MIRIAILDDYQNASLEMADWSPLAGRAVITVATVSHRALAATEADRIDRSSQRGHRCGSRGPSEISW
jgi:hypothetical protein